MDASSTRFAITVHTARYLLVATVATVVVCRASVPVAQSDGTPIVIPEVSLHAASDAIAITNLALRTDHGSMPNLARLRFACAGDEGSIVGEIDIVIANCPAPLRLRLQLGASIDHDQLGTFESEHRWLIVAAVGRSLATPTNACTGRVRTIPERHRACLDAERQRTVQRRVFFDEAQRRWPAY